jgi:hypothetical protein
MPVFNPIDHLREAFYPMFDQIESAILATTLFAQGITLALLAAAAGGLLVLLALKISEYYASGTTRTIASALYAA